MEASRKTNIMVIISLLYERADLSFPGTHFLRIIFPSIPVHKNITVMNSALLWRLTAMSREP